MPSIFQFLKNLANPKTTPPSIRRFIETSYHSKNAQILKTVKDAPPKVDEISSKDNPATQSGITHPGQLEMEGLRQEPPEISQSRPTPGDISKGAMGPER